VVELLPLKDSLQRDFYAEMCRLENWSVRTLRAKIDGMLFERTGLSRKPAELAEQELRALRDEDRLTPDLVFRDPYVLDFLGLHDSYSERELEAAILREIESFLLELGNGFAFIARQKRIRVDDEDFYIDLLLYHRKLRRLVAVDLKLEKFRPEHAGQMEFYLRWLAKHEQQPHEEPPLGLILCSAKSQERIELMELGKSSIRVFVKNCTLNKRRNLPRKRNRSKPQRIPVMCCPNLLRKLGCGSAALSPLCDAILKLDEETFDPYRDCFVRPGLMRAPPCEPIIQRR
jgi:predicted nuclease of restriction endonuclease-like (RecB) superfamily